MCKYYRFIIKNGILGSRITKTYDFGYISLDISHVRDEDNGVYSCKATNVLGEAITTASMRVKSEQIIIINYI